MGSHGSLPSVLGPALDAPHHSGARRRFVLAGSVVSEPGEPLSGLLDSPSSVRRHFASSVAHLGSAELIGAMTFHGVAVALVDLAVSLQILSGCALDLDPRRILVHIDNGSIVLIAVPHAGSDSLHVDVSGPSGWAAGFPGAVPVSDRGLADHVAAWLVCALTPLAEQVEPIDPAARWGAVADLVAVLTAQHQRDHALPVDETWARVDAVVAGLRARRPHPHEAPGRLMVAGGDGPDLALTRRSTCCQWYRAARDLGGVSVSEARCADCPALDPATNRARLGALARAGRLVAP